MTNLDTARPDRGLRPAFAGAAATFSGIGLARFAYVPLFPAMVGAGWVSGAEAGLLGAVNLGGYLAGVLGGRAVARRVGTVPALHLGMAGILASLAGCGVEGGLAWLILWRAIAGIAGGLLMVLAGPAVQGAVAASRRGLAGGIVMTGVGAGIVVAAAGVPLLLRGGVGATWLGLAGLVGCAWLAASRSWPATPVPAAATTLPGGATALALAYGLSGAGLVPHMVYFADLVVRGRGFAVTDGALAWLLFGLGGLAGPLLGGRAADRWGAEPTFRAFLGLQVVALGLVFGPGQAALLAASALGGVAAVGLTTVALARARELAGVDSGGVWARTTAAFALFQAATAFGLAALFARTGSHDALFGAGLLLSGAALIPTLVRSGRRGRALDASPPPRHKGE